MLCDKCGKNTATTHIKQIINGVVTEHDLCSACAAKEGFGKFSNGSLAEMLSSMFGDIGAVGAGTKAVRCPVCGATFADIAETGKVGCADCYRTFYSELLPYLKRVHGTVKHTGKIPNSTPLAEKPQEETVETLRMELNRLVSEEKFEEAAVVRDKIKKLEEKENE